jgi:N-acetylglucosamine kinase-like BadF-type ATPase
VPHHFGLDRPEAVMRAIHRGRLPQDRLVELPPVVFHAASSGDPVARGILDRLADEVVVTVAATMRRLRVATTDVDVVLGGGVFLGRDETFVARIRAGIEAEAPRANVIRLTVPPVLGAALIGLDEIGASARASARLRESIGHSSLRPGGRGSRRHASRAVSSLEV